MVYDIHQDNKGFIWIATDNGLCRYDGGNFKSYTCSKMSSKSGSYIKEDYKGRIWYANFDGSIFFIENDTMKSLNNEQSTIPDFALIDSSIWIVSNATLVKYNIQKLKKEQVISIEPKRTLFQNNDYLYLIDFTGKSFSKFNKEGILIVQQFCNGTNYYKSVSYKNEDYIISETKNSININFSKNFEPLASVNKTGQIIGVDNFENKLWISSKCGLFLFDFITKEFKTYLENEIVSHLIKDSKGNYWITTMNGIYIFPANSNQHNYPIPSKTCKLKVFQNELYLFDAQGTISYFDGVQKKCIQFYSDQIHQNIYDFYIQDSKIKKFDFSKTNRHDFSKSIKFKNLFLEVFNSGCKELIKINDKYIAFALSGAMNILKDGSNANVNIWDSIFKSNVYKNQIGEHIQNVSSFFNGQRAKSIAFDSVNQTLYCSTNFGTKAVTPKAVEDLLFNGSAIYADKIISSNSKTILLSTNGNLLFRNGNKEIISLSNLNNTEPYIQLKLENKIVILRTKLHVYYISIEQLNEQTTFKDLSILFVSTQLNEIIDIALIDSFFYISTPNELIESKIGSLVNNNDYSFFINSIQVSNRILYNTHKINLNSNEHDIKIDFSILDYLQNTKTIEYQLNNETWKTLDPSQRKIEFASLASDQYVLKFKINGIVQREFIEFSIPKPWYLTFWFLAVCIIVLTSLIYLLTKYFIKKNHKQNQLILEKTTLEKDLRQSILSGIKSQMNPHFLFNALNTIQSYIITEDKENASNYLSKFSKLTRKILDMSDRETITLQEEIDALILYVELEKMRFDDLNFTIEFDKDILANELLLPSMIIQPYVENAIKHGLLHKKGDRQLFIKINKSSSHLIIMIEDNGIGRKQSSVINKSKTENHRSFATSANFKRIELLNAEKNEIGIEYFDKVNEDGEATGTVVQIKLPIKLNQ